MATLLIFTAVLILLPINVLKVNCDLFDGLSSSSSPTANAVCFTSEDCRRDRNQPDNSQQGPANQKPPTNLLPLFCQSSSLECLCNRLQLHSHDSIENSPLTNCVRCNDPVKTSAETSVDQVDPCTALDPYSLCNRSVGLCECSLTSQDRESSDKLIKQQESDLSTKSPGSVCLHRHLSEHYNFSSGISAHDHVGGQVGAFVTPEPFSEWLLSLLLAYLIPATVILIFVWFLYKQGCCNCGCGRGGSRGTAGGGGGDDSEMVLYRQL